MNSPPHHPQKRPGSVSPEKSDRQSFLLKSGRFSSPSFKRKTCTPKSRGGVKPGIGNPKTAHAFACFAAAVPSRGFHQGQDKRATQQKGTAGRTARRIFADLAEMGRFVAFLGFGPRAHHFVDANKMMPSCDDGAPISHLDHRAAIQARRFAHLYYGRSVKRSKNNRQTVIGKSKTPHGRQPCARGAGVHGRRTSDRSLTAALMLVHDAGRAGSGARPNRDRNAVITITKRQPEVMAIRANAVSVAESAT